MFIGIDWGGTKIEGVALTKEGKEIIRLRQDTPRHDYHGCIGVIAQLSRTHRAGDRADR